MNVNLPPSDTGSLIAEYLTSEDLANVRSIPFFSNWFGQSNRAERTLNRCVIKDDAESYDPEMYTDSIGYRIELEGEEQHGECLGSIYRLYPRYSSEVMYNLPYDNLEEMKKFMEISGSSANNILRYIGSFDVFTSPSNEVFDYLLEKNTSELPGGVAIKYFELNGSTEKRKNFIKKAGVHIHGYDLVQLFELLDRSEALTKQLLDIGGEEVAEIVFEMSIREEFPELINLVIPYLTPEILDRAFTQARIKYHSTDDDQVQQAITNAYANSEYAETLEEEPDYVPE